jgi:twitching motility protein PilT
MPDISGLLSEMASHQASDLHLKAGSPPFVRRNGRLGALDLPVVRSADLEDLAHQILPVDRADEFHATGETDFGMGFSGVGRFRVSVMRQRGSVSVVFRRVPTTPPTFADLGLPGLVRQLAERPSGLILVTGPADSGKSSTIAAMVNHINETTTASIITIEDPIELLYSDHRAFVSQREVGTDTRSHRDGLRRSLRHDPDVIYIDQVPDVDVMSLVLAAASGRLVLSSLPTLNALETIQRVIDFFPVHHSRQVRQSLASVLQGIVSQRLLPREDEQGKVAAFELLSMTPRIHDSITEVPGSENLEGLMADGEYYGMQTMDQHLLELHNRRLISKRDAVAASSHPQELRIMLQAPH